MPSWWEANRQKILSDILSGEVSSQGAASQWKPKAKSGNTMRSNPSRTSGNSQSSMGQAGRSQSPFDFSEILKNMKSISFK